MYRFFLSLFVTGTAAVFFIFLGFFLWAKEVRSFEERLVQKGKEAASLLEALTPVTNDSKYRIAVSKIMSRLVHSSKSQKQDMLVQEAFLLNRQGRVLVHNNVMYMAKSQKNKYRLPEYHDVTRKSQEDPVFLRPIRYEETVVADFRERLEEVLLSYIGFEELIMPYIPLLNSFFPKHIISKYHVSVLCYPLDSLKYTSTLHLTGEFRGFSNILSPITYYKENHTYPLISGLFLLFCFFVFIQSKSPRNVSSKVSSKVPADSEKNLYDDSTLTRYRPAAQQGSTIQQEHGGYAHPLAETLVHSRGHPLPNQSVPGSADTTMTQYALPQDSALSPQHKSIYTAEAIPLGPSAF